MRSLLEVVTGLVFPANTSSLQSEEARTPAEVLARNGFRCFQPSTA